LIFRARKALRGALVMEGAASGNDWAWSATR
jgi:hypothetical protein